MSESETFPLRNPECAAVIAEHVDGPNALAPNALAPNALAMEYADDSKLLQGKTEDALLRGHVEKGAQTLVPQKGQLDHLHRVDPPAKMAVEDLEYVAMPPTEFTSDGVKKAYADVAGKWLRGWHRIPVNIDLDGDHKTDAYDRYPLMWSIPSKLKLASSKENAVEIEGKIMLRNERCELIETKDYYRVKVWDDHIDNLAHNIRADGYIMHFDNETQTWWRLGQLQYIFNHTEGRGTCYGPNLPATSQWYGPDCHINECPPSVFADPADRDK